MAQAQPRSSRLMRLVLNAGGIGIAVGAISVEEELALAVLLEAFAIDDRHRHLRAVARLDHQPLGRILRRVVARRDLLDLEHLERGRSPGDSRRRSSA